MKIELIKLAHECDLKKQYGQADFFTKLALDLAFLDDETPTGEGMSGSYYTNFTPEQKEQLRGLGPIKDNLGVKRFFARDELIQEKIAQTVFAPLINQHTDIKCVTSPVNIPFSGAINNKILSTQHANGVHPDHGPSRVVYFVTRNTEQAIKNKLFQIGIKWGDMHWGNYMVDEKRYNALIEKYNKSYNEYETNGVNMDTKQYSAKSATDQDFSDLEHNNPEMFNLSTGATIVDLGAFQARPGTLAEQALIQFIQNLEPKASNSFVKLILQQAKRMLVRL